MSDRTFSENFVAFHYAMGCGLAYGMGSKSWGNGLFVFLFLIVIEVIVRVVRRVLLPTPKAEGQ